jgi:hypothetical protein
MPIDPAIVADTTARRRRRQATVARLADAEPVRDLDRGWTAAVALARLACRDRRAGPLLQRWQRDGAPPDAPDVERLDASLLEARGEAWRRRRAEHRREHLDQIDRSLWD